MADFYTSYNITHVLEGGYSNHKNDRGGETWRGISRVHNPHWKGWSTIDSMKSKPNFPTNLKSRADLQEQVLEFYKANYFSPLKLHMVSNQEVANRLYDIAVLMGVGTSARFLQRSLNITNQRQRLYPDLVVDGQVGSKTLTALNNHPNIDVILKILNTLKGQRFLDLAESNESQEDFINGWFKNRIASIITDKNNNIA